jgi:hypothetical protein
MFRELTNLYEKKRFYTEIGELTKHQRVIFLKQQSWLFISLGILPLTKRFAVRDLWKREHVGTHSSYYSSEVESHGVVMVRLTPL